MSELCRRQIIRQQQIMKKSALTVLIALLPLGAIAQTPSINEDGKKIEKEKMETKDYLPEVHGTIRAKYEYQTTMGAGRFEVRNARVSVTGNVLPSVAYKAEIDLSDEGQIKMLDAYARLFPTKGLTVTAGQMRVPFTIDAHRSPHQQYFPNRSFIAKQVGNVRDVGFTVGYTLPTDVPITVEGGLFNGSGLTNQKEWHKEVNYSAKAQFLFTKGLNLTLSVQSIQPEEVRMQSYDIGAYYETGRFHIEGEYLYKQYSGNAFKDVHAVNTFINSYENTETIADLVDTAFYGITCYIWGSGRKVMVYLHGGTEAAALVHIESYQTLLSFPHTAGLLMVWKEQIFL